MRFCTALLTATFLTCPVLGADAPSYGLEIGQHGFTPATLAIPAGARIELRITNSRSLPSEFESFDLNREKVVPPGATVTVWIGPLPAGKYKFFDDFNPGITGWILAAELSAGAPL
jgi:heme/copper-type cytochrome/quinol oxidase subunit 2